MKPNKVLVAVTSFDYTDNADKLKTFFSSAYDTIIIHSNNLNECPKTVDYIIPNNYYTGLWNKSIQKTIEGDYEWLLFVASDVSILNQEIQSLSELINSITQDNNIGVYTFSVDPKSRRTYNELFNQQTKTIRDTSKIEGFCFLCRTSILRKMYPIDYSANQYGWGLDWGMIEIAKRNKLRTVVDDRVIVYHPRSLYPINEKIALKQMMAFLKNLKKQEIQMNRIIIINNLIKTHKYDSYLEIGTRFKKDCFDQIQCNHKLCVDPGKNDIYNFNITSDEFFDINQQKFDIIFIDGLHTAEQSYKDIVNSIKILNDNGSIVVHDTNPPTEFHATEKQYTPKENIIAGYNWNGTVWKSIFKLRKERKDLIFETYECDWGVTIIRKGNGSLLELDNDFFSFEIFDKNRKEILNTK